MLNFRFINIALIVIFIGLLSASYFKHLSLWYAIILICIWILTTISGSFFIRWNYHFKSLNSNPNITKNQVAITFDDGPNSEFTPKVLAILKQYNAKATFFCIGKHIETNPIVFKNIIEQGHTIGNHTFSHDNTFGFYSTEKVIFDLKKTNTIIADYSNLNIRLYRPAFGVTNPRIKKAIQTIGLQSIGWNVRSLDTTFRSSKSVLKRITKKISKGDIILLHDTSQKTIVVLEQLLLFLQEQNIESVTIDSLFNIQPYA